MVSVLTALASRAGLTLLDEPTAGLDAVAREQFYRLLLEDFSHTGRTFVLSTHIIGEAAPPLRGGPDPERGPDHGARPHRRTAGAVPHRLRPRGLLPLVLYFGLALLAVLLGCLSGLLMRRSRLSGGLIYSTGLLLLILLWPACRLILASPAVWGDLPLFLLLSLPVSAALLEFPLFRALARLSVR